jgi:hypothetical protein
LSKGDDGGKRLAINIIPLEQPTKGFLQLLMFSLHNSPLSGHPG